jgi:beta-lactamase regulating signal transducer with metallopeptidase domain
MTSNLMFTWLANSALASTMLLMCGAVAVMRSRQPADKLRLIQWSLGATLLSLVLVGLPSFSVLSLGVLISSNGSQRPAFGIVTDSMAPLNNPLITVANDAAAGGRAPSLSTAEEVPQLAVARRLSPLPHTNLSVLATRAICLTYVTGMLAVLMRWIMARVQLQRVLRKSGAVPSEIQAELSRVAKVDCKHVLLLASDDIATPIMCGTMRPMIVLPSCVLCEVDKTRLRYYLAHEWAHVSQHHFATWQLATLLQFFLYYHPVFWLVRRQLSTSMDQLADAVASDQGASTVDYAAFLVELSRRRFASSPRLTLGIYDKQSRLRQRVVFLLEASAPPKSFCNRKTSFLMGAAALALGILVSAIRLDADPANTKSNEHTEQNK